MIKKREVIFTLIKDKEGYIIREQGGISPYKLEHGETRITDNKARTILACVVCDKMCSWIRLCSKCRAVIDDLGSCPSCARMGIQPGHFQCHGWQDEDEVDCIYADYHQILEERGKCTCGHISRVWWTDYMDGGIKK
jgi:hypothetical protein